LEDLTFEIFMIEEVLSSMKKSLNDNYLRITRSIAETVNTNSMNHEKLIRLAYKVGVDEIHIADNNGVFIDSTISEFIGLDSRSKELTRPFVKLLDKPGSEIVQDAYMRDSDKKMFQYIGVSLGLRKGFLLVGMHPKELQNILENSNIQFIIDHFHYAENGYSYILDPVKQICTHHVNHDLIGLDMSELDFAHKIFEIENGSFTYNWKGNEIFTTFNTTPAGVIVAAVPTSTYLNELIPIRNAMFITSLLSLIITIVILSLITRIAIAPLHKINASLTQIASGEADLTQRIDINSKDEIGNVASNFNKFMEKQQHLISGIQEVVEQTGGIKNSIMQNTQSTAGAISQIKDVVNNVESKINSMNDNVDDNATAMVEITSNTESFDNVIGKQALMVEESTASITEMITSLNNVGSITKNKQRSTLALKETAEEGRRQIDETSEHFAVVADKVTSIQEMADTINGIASQTNLLSMNAAIEAAHAGEAGKGFAVVAEEIRKLAETASDSSRAITNLISEITDGIKNTSENMVTTLSTFASISNEVESTVNAFMEIESSVAELIVGGQQIMTSTEKIHNITIEVKSGSSEIHKGIDSSNKALVVIKDNSDEVSEGINQISTGAVSVADAMDSLSSISNELNRITQTLAKEFNQFIT
ncbi:MAG: methyl-accepting chemotaxis protein, partial [Spirochaetales bacterium]|nr:methyl-accepting chemotaxis protein [Spirochaetales bacterium]